MHLKGCRVVSVSPSRLTRKRRWRYVAARLGCHLAGRMNRLIVYSCFLGPKETTSCHIVACPEGVGTKHQKVAKRRVWAIPWSS